MVTDSRTDYFIFFQGKRHPREMGGPEVQAFLSWLLSPMERLN